MGDPRQESIERVSAAIGTIRSKGRLLEDVAWPREVETAFFDGGAERLPKVTYEVDRDTLGAELSLLTEVERGLAGDDAVTRWLRALIGSHVDRNRLLLAVGTREFGRISSEIYGGARSRFFGLSITNLDLAEHLEKRLATHGWDAARAPEEPMDAGRLVEFLQTRIQKRRAPIQVVLDPDCNAKAIAGAKKVRVRPDATFTSWEAEGLYRHEVETHAFSALNGADSAFPQLLRSGGPRSTPTQEGLAVFAELYHRSLATPRLHRLATRVRLVAMAEDGASFLDVYRHLVRETGSSPRDAYLDAARVFRGGPPEGGGPFTKDSCYLAGLVHVHAFLAAFVRAGFRDECELLLAGRFPLEHFEAIVELHALGMLSTPRWLPRWVREWETLLPYFAFASFMDGIELKPVEERYADVIRLAAAARAPQPTAS